MLFQPPMYHQNKGEGVCFYPIISMYIYLYYLYSLCMYVFIYLYLSMNTRPILDSKVIGALFGAHFFGEKAILFAHTPETDAIFNDF